MWVRLCDTVRVRAKVWVPVLNDVLIRVIPFFSITRGDSTDVWSENRSYNKRADQGSLADRSFANRLDQGQQNRRQDDGHYSCSKDRAYFKRPDQALVERTYVKTPYQGQGHRDKARPNQGAEDKTYTDDYDMRQDERTYVKAPYLGQGHKNNQWSADKSYNEGNVTRHEGRTYDKSYDHHLARQKVSRKSQDKSNGSVPSTSTRCEWVEGPRSIHDKSDRFEVGMQQAPFTYSQMNHPPKRSAHPSQTVPRDVAMSTYRAVNDSPPGTSGMSRVVADDDYHDLYEVSIPATPTNALVPTSKGHNNWYRNWTSTGNAIDPRDVRPDPPGTAAEDSLSEFDLSTLPMETLEAVTLRRFAEYSKLMRRSMRQEYKQMNQLIKDFTEEVMERNKALLDENQSNNTENQSNSTENNTDEDMKKDSSCSIM